MINKNKENVINMIGNNRNLSPNKLSATRKPMISPRRIGGASQTLVKTQSNKNIFNNKGNTSYHESNSKPLIFNFNQSNTDFEDENQGYGHDYNGNLGQSPRTNFEVQSRMKNSKGSRVNLTGNQIQSQNPNPMFSSKSCINHQ